MKPLIVRCHTLMPLTFMLGAVAFGLSACDARNDTVASSYQSAKQAEVVSPNQAAPSSIAPLPQAGTQPVVAAPPVPLAPVTPYRASTSAPLAPAETPQHPIQQVAEDNVQRPRYAPPDPRSSQTASAPKAVVLARLGLIESIEPVRERPQGSGAGAVIGGVLGAVVGNQFGHGLGRAAMTGIGVAGGAVAGNNLERNHKENISGYRVTVRMDNGHLRTFQRSTSGGLQVGDRVRVDASSFRRV